MMVKNDLHTHTTVSSDTDETVLIDKPLDLHLGNSEKFALSTVSISPHSRIFEKNILFLGSSITFGSNSKGISFSDYICVRNCAQMIKEAVPGTTLADNGADSYVSRLRNLDEQMNVDLLVCQLSTNDCWRDSPLGHVTQSRNHEDFDTQTVAGAIEYIIAYTRKIWGCPIVFYTSPRYGNEKYGQMVDILHTVAEKWSISVIDMWTDEQFNNISGDEKSLYMTDDIHPSQAGYLKWWVPYMEPFIFEALSV